MSTLGAILRGPLMMYTVVWIVYCIGYDAIFLQSPLQMRLKDRNLFTYSTSRWLVSGFPDGFHYGLLVIL
jgi:hypothetical protein